MDIWDASIGWKTLIVRASSAAEARKLAIEELDGLKLFETTFEVPGLTDDWPRRLDPDGPSEILVEGSE